jgi:hypothetical protein
VRLLTRARCSRGQTSAEYLGGLLLLVAIVAVLVTSGAGGQVAGGIHHAICFIAGEDCSGGGENGPEWGAGNAPPLSECVRNSSQRGIAGSVKIDWFTLGGGVDGIKELRADGSTKVTIRANANAGLDFGAEVGISAGKKSSKVGTGGSAKVIGSVARAWVFKTEGEADGFIDDVKKKVIAIADPRPNLPLTHDDADIKLPDYDEQTIQGGVEVRVKRGTGTSYVEGNLGASVGATCKRSASANEEAGARVLLDAKLDLRVPENRAAVMAFVDGRDESGQPVSRLVSARDVGGRLLTDSTFNVKAYVLSRDKKVVGFSAGVFGVSGEYTSENADLVAAYYRPAGDSFGFKEWDGCLSDEL